MVQFMKILIASTLATSALLLSITSNADINLKAYSWQTEYSGDIGQGTNNVSFDNLGFDDGSSTSFSLTFRHPVPVLPNIKLQQTTLDETADGTLSSGQIFEITDIEFDADVTTSLDLSHLDVTLFYSLFAIDIGLTGRNFDTETSVSSDTPPEEASAELDAWVPMVYLGVNADLPLTGLYVDAAINTISYDGNRLQDTQAALGYQLDGALPLTAELGYRAMNLKLEDLDDIEGDFTIDGWFLSLGLTF